MTGKVDQNNARFGEKESDASCRKRAAHSINTVAVASSPRISWHTFERYYFGGASNAGAVRSVVAFFAEFLMSRTRDGTFSTA